MPLARLVEHELTVKLGAGVQLPFDNREVTGAPRLGVFPGTETLRLQLVQHAVV